MEMLLALVIAYMMVGPDRFTLAATRGAAGAARGAARGYRTGGAGRSAGRGRKARGGSTARSRGGRGPGAGSRAGGRSKKRTGSTANGGAQGKRFARTRAAMVGARDGWRKGTDDARRRRADGTDTFGRAKRAAGWTKQKVRDAKQRKAERAAKLSEATDAHKTDPEAKPEPDTTTTTDPAAPDATPTPKVSDPAAETTKGPHPMTIQTTELGSPAEVQAEAQQASQVLADIEDALTSLRAWAGVLSDRWSSAPWATAELNAATAAVAESADPQVNPEAMTEALQALIVAAQHAHELTEVADELKAEGDLEHFRAS